MVATRPHRMDFAAVMRVSLRDNYRKFWWFSTATLAGAGVFFFSPARDILLGILLLITGAGTPYLRSLIMLRLLKKSPVAYREHVLEFNEEEFRTLERSDLISRFRYADVVKSKVLPEGLQIWITHQIWVFVPRSAFEPADLIEEAHRLMTVASSGMRG